MGHSPSRDEFRLRPGSDSMCTQLGAADTLLLGRKTYDSFAGAWPDREVEGGEDAYFAKKLGDARKSNPPPARASGQFVPVATPAVRSPPKNTWATNNAVS